MCQCQKQSCCGSSGYGCQTSKGCGSSNGGCSSHQSCEDHSHHSGCDFSHKLIALADQAWMEVLKEKIKKEIELNDHKIGEVARIVAAANHDRWQRKMAKKQACASFEDQLKGLFCSSSGCKTTDKK